MSSNGFIEIEAEEEVASISIDDISSFCKRYKSDEYPDKCVVKIYLKSDDIPLMMDNLTREEADKLYAYIKASVSCKHDVSNIMNV